MSKDSGKINIHKWDAVGFVASWYVDTVFVSRRAIFNGVNYFTNIGKDEYDLTNCTIEKWAVCDILHCEHGPAIKYVHDDGSIIEYWFFNNKKCQKINKYNLFNNGNFLKIEGYAGPIVIVSIYDGVCFFKGLNNKQFVFDGRKSK
jgi:hypothetical protein